MAPRHPVTPVTPVPPLTAAGALVRDDAVRPRRPRARGRRAGAALLLPVAGLALAGCGALPADGPPTSEQREVAGAEAVRLATSGDLTVSVGDEPSLTVTAAEGVVGRITTEVRDGVLVIDLPGRWVNVGRMEFDLVLPAVTGVELDGSGSISAGGVRGEALDVRLDGSGDVELDALDVDALAVTIGGSGTVRAEGAADRQQVVLGGSGGYDADDLTSSDATVRIDGSGTVVVDASRTLDAEITGSGDVRYAGDPEVSRDISGSGSVVED